ncbi:hypothetical protein DPMN_114928 [Dreissena polymorpha]|uniref:Uncharacterized protein n=1 Tax=Dreissena polymorpha TaxID=45954 RepID=A0A9D4KL15_DREPO|nr:hypothetical protein DPMN_114928 [Dreissena polymorpha]
MVLFAATLEALPSSIRDSRFQRWATSSGRAFHKRLASKRTGQDVVTSLRRPPLERYG